MSTYSWSLTNATVSEGLSILAEQPIAEGSADTSAQATRDGIAALDVATEAAGVTVDNLLVKGADFPVVYVLSDGTHLALSVTPDED